MDVRGGLVAFNIAVASNSPDIKQRVNFSIRLNRSLHAVTSASSLGDQLIRTLRNSLVAVFKDRSHVSERGTVHACIRT